MVPAVTPLRSLSTARSCARIDSADRVEVHHAWLLAAIGVRKTFPHGLGHNRKSTISWARIGRLTMTIATSLWLVTFWAHGRAVARRCRGLLGLSFADHAGDPE